MAWDPALEDLMPDEVTIIRPTTAGRSIYGYSTGYSVLGTFPSRYVQKATRVRDQTGDRIEGEGIEWVRSTIPLTTGYMALKDGKALGIQAVENYGDEEGHHHSKILYGWREARGGR